MRKRKEDLDEVSYPGRGLFWLGCSWGEDTLKYMIVVYLVDKGGVGDFLGWLALGGVGDWNMGSKDFHLQN